MNGEHEKAILDTNGRLVKVETDVSWIKEQLKKAVNRLPGWATALISFLMGAIGWLIHFI